MSGLAMAVAGTTRPCSGACHEISHAIDRLFPAKSTPHGEQVGVGARFATFVRGDYATLVAMTEALRRCDLPLTPGDLGLTSAEFAAAVDFAPQTRPDRFTILEHLAMSPEQVREQVESFLNYRV
jgi:glycerol-1-phosphate dehydrogenase [NAD(P)+]